MQQLTALPNVTCKPFVIKGFRYTAFECSLIIIRHGIKYKDIAATYKGWKKFLFLGAVFSGEIAERCSHSDR